MSVVQQSENQSGLAACLTTLQNVLSQPISDDGLARDVALVESSSDMRRFDNVKAMLDRYAVSSF